MGRKLFVGNLPFDITDEELKELFSRAGTCESVAVVKDRLTGRSRGFGFIEMASDEEARRAIAELNGTELGGRAVSVNEARERSAGGRSAGALRPSQRFGADAPPSGRPFRKDGKSRRGLRGRKRSI